VSSVKYLGVHLSSDLKWDTHITNILAKANKILGLMKATLHKAPIKVKKLAYLTLCRPILEYASDIWDPTHNYLINKLELFQNKALRFVFNVKGRDTSMTEVKNKNHIQTLSKRRRDARFSTFIKILEHTDMHPSLNATLTSMESNSSMSTRNNTTLNSYYARTNILYNSFLVRTAREIRAGDTGDEDAL
jgi:hypothetical protein